jgi:hypothetical protein
MASPAYFSYNTFTTPSSVIGNISAVMKFNFSAMAEKNILPGEHQTGEWVPPAGSVPGTYLQI